MPFQVSFDEKDCIITSRLQGKFDWTVVEKMVPQLSKLIKQHSCARILLDFHESDMNLSTLGIYLTPQKLAAEFKKNGVDIYPLKRALYISTEDPSYNFLETVTINNSQTLKIFFDESLARSWLIEQN